jgi:putative transposase
VFEFIAAEKANDRRFSVQFACQVLGVSRAGFYKWRDRRDDPGGRARTNARLVDAIRDVHAEFAMYGSPRMHRELLARGHQTGRHRVARLMRNAGIEAVRGRPRGYHRTAPPRRRPDLVDLVQRRFQASEPNELWCVDFTYVPTDQGWLYLTAIIDVFSRRIVGWSMNSVLNIQLALEALQTAIALRGRPRDVIVHSDRGAQFTSQEWQDALANAGLRPSLGRLGTALDNALMESWFGSFKNEVVHPNPKFATRTQARAAIANYILFHNARRRHSALDYISPIDYEEANINN